MACPMVGDIVRETVSSRRAWVKEGDRPELGSASSYSRNGKLMLVPLPPILRQYAKKRKKAQGQGGRFRCNASYPIHFQRSA